MCVADWEYTLTSLVFFSFTLSFVNWYSDCYPVTLLALNSQCYGYPVTLLALNSQCSDGYPVTLLALNSQCYICVADWEYTVTSLLFSSYLYLFLLRQSGTSDLKTGRLVATLLHSWHCRVNVTAVWPPSGRRQGDREGAPWSRVTEREPPGAG